MTQQWKISPDFLFVVIFSINIRGKCFIYFIVCCNCTGLSIRIDWFNEKFRWMEIPERKWINSDTITTKRQDFPKCDLKTSYFRYTCFFNMQIPGPHLTVHAWPLNLIEPRLLSRILSHQSEFWLQCWLWSTPTKGGRNGTQNSFTLCISFHRDPGWSYHPHCRLQATCLSGFWEWLHRSSLQSQLSLLINVLCSF